MSLRSITTGLLAVSLLSVAVAPGAAAVPCDDAGDCIVWPILDVPEKCIPVSNCPGYLGGIAGDSMRWAAGYVTSLVCTYVGC